MLATQKGRSKPSRISWSRWGRGMRGDDNRRKRTKSKFHHRVHREHKERRQMGAVIVLPGLSRVGRAVKGGGENRCGCFDKGSCRGRIRDGAAADAVTGREGGGGAGGGA